MRILLVNPAFDYYHRHLLVSAPLSLAYLASCLTKECYQVEILDAVAGEIRRKGKNWHYGLEDRQVIEKIKKFKPDVVGVTCPFSLRIGNALHAAKLIKGISRKIITAMGGVHPTIFPAEMVAHRYVDYAIMGEGEESFLQLIKALERGNEFPGLRIDGCAYKKDRQVKVNQKKEFIENLNLLPFPARELLPMEFYINKQTIWFGLGKQRSASIVTSRGCPRRCTFCSNYLSCGRRWRGRSVENVFEEIKLMVEKYRIEEIFFIDDNLTFDKDRVMKLCKMILRQGIKFKWNTPNGIAAGGLDTDLVTMMKRAGCVNICIGIESGNEMVRNGIIRKGLSEQTIRKALNACNMAGMPVVGFFILGIPGDRENTFKDTINMVKNLPFSMIAASFFTPYPGTKLYDDCVTKGYIEKDYLKIIDLSNAPNLVFPQVETPDFDKETLRNWEKRIYYEFFKSHFWSLVYSTVTLKNTFFKWGLIRRFIKEKFNI